MWRRRRRKKKPILVQGSNEVCINVIPFNVRKGTATNSCIYGIFVTGVQLPSIYHDANT